MQVKIQPSLRMGTVLLLFLFTSEEACAEFIIKSVDLIMQPSDEVQRSTNVSLKCEAEVSRSPGSHLNYKYIFYKDYVKLNTDQISATDGLYSIPDVRVSHSGKYKCALSIKTETKESRVKDLKVKGLLTPVLKVDKLTLTEGDDVTAVCTAEGETGFLTFFFRDGPEELYRKDTYSQKVEHNLTVTKRHKNMFCYYSINLSGSLETSNNSNVISVDFQELKIKPDIKVMPSTDVTEGDPITLSCSVNMTHQRNSDLIIHLIHEKNTMLRLNMTQEDYKVIAMANDSGKYECISKLGGVHKSSSVNITVKELFSVPVLSIHPAEVFEGENFTISCQISSFDSEEIQRNITYSIFRDNTIIINSNNYSDTAGKVTNEEYMCKAEANRITKESQRVLFGAKVLVSKPEITAYGPVIVDKPFLILCHSENGTLPIIYSLMRNDITLNRTEVSDPHEKAHFLALISTPSDISSYLCAAENNGRVKMSERLHVTVIVPVETPLLTVVPVPGNIEEGYNITLICGIPKGSPPISFMFYASNPTPIHNTTVQSNSSSFVLSTVNREKSGNYYCTASNMAGMSMSNIVTVEVSWAKWKKALIAVFFMLLVALLVLFIMIRYKAKRGKREMAAKLSVKPASPKSDDSLTLSLTHDTHYSTHTVEVNNKESVWSERPPDQDSLELPNEGDVEYTEVVHPQPVDPTRTTPVRIC
ncbi:platelet endothelial cell adhesion molecule isoform X3 [Ctenopharyngodon idella]|uniref:platelet endothelial cell adhesion molecule isoform X3 n=1 Tax=Ctenopharyngodon idella TaxID=7959 RepID=UPI0022314BE3|nr:platelet endothelial cell adhesion molecule isoform X3 [Ctenopharyngodon idella]